MTRSFWMAVLFLLKSSALYAQTHHPEDFLKSVQGSQAEGARIVDHFCASCHGVDPLIQVGAPKTGDVAAWKMRKKQGMDQLFKHVCEGVGAMPPRGGCFECSDEQLKKAIEALVRPSL